MVKFRENLYIGGLRDLAEDLQKVGITAILNVAYEIDVQPIPPQIIRYIKVSLNDSDENKKYMKVMAINTLEELLTQGETVMVMCAAGLSRSVYTAVMTIARMEGKKDWIEVFDELQKIHPFALIGPLFHGENKFYRYYKEQEEKSDVQEESPKED